MNRNIYIVNNQIHSYNNFDTIKYDKIDHIVNFSVDNMICDMLNTIDKSLANSLLDLMFNKIRIGGKLILTLDNLELLCKNYINGIVDPQQFLDIVHKMQSITSLGEIEKIVSKYSNHFKLIQSELSSDRFIIVLQRESL